MILAPARTNIRKAQVSRSRAIPPSVGGLNAVDAITDMPETDALLLDNFFCQPDFIELRGGHESHATGIGAAVDGLFTWEGPSSSKMFGAKSTDIYEVTSSGAVGAAAVSSLTNGQWQDTMMATSGGNFLVIANGADSIRNYNGTTWSTPSITNVTSSTIDNVAIHARRLWMVEENSTAAWYLPVDSVAGAATEFNLGPLFTRGGKLQAIGSLTRDGGNGPDDFAVFLSSNGEAALYRGTDPASASTWALVGVYDIPRPIGKRCLTKVGADLAVLSRSGLISLTSVLGLDRTVAERAAVTNKIDRFITDDANSFASNFGWEVARKHDANMLLINVPTSANSSQRQWVMNTLTGAWSQFTGLNMNTFTTLNGELYGGGNSGTVWKLDTGFQDNGGGIVADLKTAFSYFGARGREKHFKMMRTLFESNGGPGFFMGLDTDFQDTPLSGTPSVVSQTGDVWDTGTWDSAVWGAGNQITRDWQGASAIGETVAVRLRVTSDGASFKIYGHELVAEVGGIH